MLLSNLRALGRTWPSLTGDTIPVTTLALTTPHSDFNQDSQMEQGRSPGCQGWEGLKETPGSAARKVTEVVSVCASRCFHHSGQGMGLVVHPKCCQRHSRCLRCSAGPHQGRVQLVTALISEPVWTGKSPSVDDGELTYTGTFSFL